jgi:hypothetical protein
MKVLRVALPVCVLVGAFSALVGSWWTVVAKVLVVFGQTLTLRDLRRRQRESEPSTG